MGCDVVGGRLCDMVRVFVKFGEFCGIDGSYIS